MPFKQTYHLVYNFYGYDDTQVAVFFSANDAIKYSQEQMEKSHGYGRYEIQSTELDVNVLGRVYYVYNGNMIAGAFGFNFYSFHSLAIEYLQNLKTNQSDKYFAEGYKMGSLDLDVTPVVYLYWVLKQMRVQRSIKVPKFIGYEIAKALLSN